MDPPPIDPLATYARDDDLEFEPVNYPGPLAPTWDGTPPDYDAAVAALLEELDRLREPDHERLAA